tara:strand:+ start:615 stop:758 length:144 start_codon:yes stop_codon:yes gene_type:complete
MKYFLYVMLLLLYACESNNVIKNTKKNKKNQNIQMEVTTEPTIKIKK